MPRIRTVKPSIFTSPSLARVDVAARYLFIGLFTEADDEGRLLDSPKKIAGNLFPLDDHITANKVAGWLDQLDSEGCLERYSVDGVRYIQLDFEKHQRISHPTPSIFPSPSGEIPESLRPEVEVEVEVEVESSKAAAPSNGQSKNPLDALNLGLVESMWANHRGWNTEVTFAYLHALVSGGKRGIPACGARAVNAAIDDLYANAASVSDPAAYLRERAESHTQGVSRR